MESENKVQNNKEYDNSNKNDKKDIDSLQNPQDSDTVKKEVKKSDSHSTVPAEE